MLFVALENALAALLFCPRHTASFARRGVPFNSPSWSTHSPYPASTASRRQGQGRVRPATPHLLLVVPSSISILWRFRRLDIRRRRRSRKPNDFSSPMGSRRINIIATDLCLLASQRRSNSLRDRANILHSQVAPMVLTRRPERNRFGGEIICSGGPCSRSLSPKAL
jgi:hypothetical protein